MSLSLLVGTTVMKHILLFSEMASSNLALLSQAVSHEWPCLKKWVFLEILPIEEANVSELANDNQCHTFIMLMVISSISSNVSLRMYPVLYYIIQAWIM